MSRLSDYYGFQPDLGYVLKLKHIKKKYIVYFKLAHLCEGDCSRYHCSHCAGWKIFNIKYKYLETEHRKLVDSGDARDYNYYSPKNYELEEDVYHEGEANEILTNLLASKKYKILHNI